MNPKDYHVFMAAAPHKGQRLVAEASARFKVVAAGRRWGKSELGRMLAVAYAKRGYDVVLLGQNAKMTARIWYNLKADNPPDVLFINEPERQVHFHSDGTLAVRSAHYPIQLAGAGADYAILDEAAFMGQEVWAELIKPMLDERQGGAALLSTTNGNNWFYDLWREGTIHRDQEWRSFHYPTSANPYISPDEIEQLRREMPERAAAQELDANFVSDLPLNIMDKPLSVSVIANAAPYYPNHRYCMGVDWSTHTDSGAVAVIDGTTRLLVAWEHLPSRPFNETKSRIHTLASVWKPGAIWADSNSLGSVYIDTLQSEGLPVRPFTMTLGSRKPLIENFIAALTDQRLALLDDEALRRALAALTHDPLHDRYTNLNSLALALMLAWYGVEPGTVRVDFA